MILFKAAREFYSLQLITTPPVAATWEASFDRGVTWVTGTPATVNGVAVTRWLLAGPSAALGTSVAQIAATVTPMVRVQEAPEIIIRDAPQVVIQ